MIILGDDLDGDDRPGGGEFRAVLRSARRRVADGVLVGDPGSAGPEG